MNLDNLLVGSGLFAAALGTSFVIYLWKCRCNPKNATNAKVILISTVAEWEFHREFFLHSVFSSRVLGMDCEWVSLPNHRKKSEEEKKLAFPRVSLIQLAPNPKLCFVIRLSKLEKIPDDLKAVLELREVLKVGVAIVDDATRLTTEYGIVCNSLLDLRFPMLNSGLDVGGYSLEKIALGIIGLSLDKSLELRCSGWENETLKTKEVNYAATDALASYLIMKKIAVQTTNPFKILFHSGWLYNSAVLNFEPFIDVRFSHQTPRRRDSIDANSKDTETSAFTYTFNSSEELVVKKKSKSKRKKAKTDETKENLSDADGKNAELGRQLVRQRPLYENCILQAPDGEVLATIPRKKADWYLQREIATLQSEDPYCVRLKFEPKGRAVFDKVYFTLEKKNICVVCGTDEQINRKNVVPQEYRTFFPDIMTSHNSHDILLLCIRCHQTSNTVDFVLRMKLSKLCGAPLSDHKYFVNEELTQISKAAKALIKPIHKKIPESRQEELRGYLREKLETQDLTVELLKTAASQPTMTLNKDYVCHGQLVVNYFAKSSERKPEHRGLMRLETMWREHFVQTMKPKHLPELWSVNYNRRSLAYEIGLITDNALAQDLREQIGLTENEIETMKLEVERADNERTTRVNNNDRPELQEFEVLPTDLLMD